MCFKVFKNTVLLLVLVMISCGNNFKSQDGSQMTEAAKTEVTSTIPNSAISQDIAPVIGANRTELYLPLLKGKRIGIVSNQTSVIFKTGETKINTPQPVHIVDSLLKLNLDIKKVFAPEHGFRGTADAGEVVKDGVDTRTGLPIISLYGNNKKPSADQLIGLDIIVFDIQDVGARFYTYISSLHYVMEACAELDITVLILDRPNPNGHYVDGPILEKGYKSFVGMHPIPVVHGMTIGEYAQMINGEGWLKNGVTCELNIIPIENYTHQSEYNLPIKPSPNLPNDASINLYPSLCFFEGTNVSIGRGTNKQFQVVGSPFFNLKRHTYEFTPQSNEGAKYPKHEGEICHGYDLSKHERLNKINLSWLIEFYNSNQNYAPKEEFFTDFFTTLAGTTQLQEQIESGMSEAEIRDTWYNGLERFKTIRSKYLIYD